jgi:thiamine kinase-like enzyme
MDISVSVLDDTTGKGVEPDMLLLKIYNTGGSPIQKWLELTKSNMTGENGSYEYSKFLEIGNVSTGSYLATLEVKVDTERTWDIKTFRIENISDIEIQNLTTPVKQGDALSFKIVVINKGETGEMLAKWWIDDGAISDSASFLAATGEAVYLDKSFADIQLTEGNHRLHASVEYKDNPSLPPFTVMETFKVEKKGAGGPGGGGGGPAPKKGIPKLSIVEFYPPEVHVERGGVTYLVVAAENLGGTDLHDVSAYITGIPEEWFEVVKGEVPVLESNESSDILVQIKIPENVTAQVVTLTVTATSTESSHQRSIIMRVFSSRADLVYFEIESVKKTLRNSEDRALGALKEGKNVSTIMEKIDEARVEIRYAENYLSNHNYDKALGHLDNVREVLEHVNKLLELASAEAGPAPTVPPAQGIPMPVLMFVFFVIVALGGMVVYLARDRISGVFSSMGTPTVRKPRARRAGPEVMAQTEGLKTEIRSTERLLETMKGQNDMGMISDSTYNELRKRNEQKIKEVKSKLKKLGV